MTGRVSCWKTRFDTVLVDDFSVVGRAGVPILALMEELNFSKTGGGNGAGENAETPENGRTRRTLHERVNIVMRKREVFGCILVCFVLVLVWLCSNC